MKSHPTHRELRLELLRARAAANRIDLARAVRDVSEQFAPVRRAVDSIGSVTGALGDRARAARWALAAGAALVRGHRLFQAASSLLGRLRSQGRFRGRIAALSLIGLVGVALLVRRARRSTASGPVASDAKKR
jgi:hypothetical protein